MNLWKQSATRQARALAHKQKRSGRLRRVGLRPPHPLRCPHWRSQRSQRLQVRAASAGPARAHKRRRHAVAAAARAPHSAPPRRLPAWRRGDARACGLERPRARAVVRLFGARGGSRLVAGRPPPTTHSGRMRAGARRPRDRGMRRDSVKRQRARGSVPSPVRRRPSCGLRVVVAGGERIFRVRSVAVTLPASALLAGTRPAAGRAREQRVNGGRRSDSTR